MLQLPLCAVLSLLGHRGVLRSPHAPRRGVAAAALRPGRSAEETAEGAEGEHDAERSTCDPGMGGTWGDHNGADFWVFLVFMKNFKMSF